MTPWSTVRSFVREPMNRKRSASTQIGVIIMEPRKVHKPAVARSALELQIDGPTGAPQLQIDAPTDAQPAVDALTDAQPADLARGLSAPQLQIDAPTDAQPAQLQIDGPTAPTAQQADLARGLQWLSIGENPHAMEIRAGASADEIQREEEIEKARLRAWLATMLDVL